MPELNGKQYAYDKDGKAKYKADLAKLQKRRKKKNPKKKIVPFGGNHTKALDDE